MAVTEDRQPVTWQGMTEAEALEVVLGPRQTNDRWADRRRAVQLIEQVDRAYQVLLHALHADLGTWQAVAAEIGKPVSTVHGWAHRAL